jgi:sensor domain CHASE-containing protein
MKSNRSLVISVLVFLIIVGGGILYVWRIGSSNVIKHERHLIDIAASHAFNLQRQLSRSLSATYALASLLHRYGTIEDFDNLAAEMINNYGGISSLQLAPQGVVLKIYPLAGNEKAIGHDLLNDPARRTEALETIKSRKLTLAGPFELIQGGIAVIGRLPVFLLQDDGSEKFWGFTIVLIRLPEFLHDTNIYSLTGKGYDFELSRLAPDTGERVVFSRSRETPLAFPVHFEFEVPNGKWTLSISQKKFLFNKLSMFIGYVMVVLMGFMLSTLTFLFLKRSEKLKFHSEELSKTNQKLENEITERRRAEEEREKLILELKDALDKVKVLSGFLPICASCKNIRDDKGYWNQIEVYISEHSEAEFTHGLCPDCAKKLYPEFYKE